ncbi:uncharacterized protein [Castor canadensis]|uniref:Uncharacterized protein n=1 Tax=Castor canadensis TaxID=51338 RepID=A0AC58LAE1_CASCN
MPLPRHSSERQMAPLSLPTHQPPRLHHLPWSPDRRGDSGPTKEGGYRYAFGIVHVHGAIYRERGFITEEGKELRNLPEIQRLLTAVQKPQAVAVVHVPGHQSAQTPEATGNRSADEAVRNAALASTTLALTLPMPELPRLPPRPEYTLEDKQWIQDHRCPEPNQQGWYRDIEGWLILPEKVDSIGPWVHHSQVCQANHQEQKDAREWTAWWHPDNPLKLKLLRPWEHAESSGAATDGLAGCSDLAQCSEQEPRRNQPSPAL